MSENLRKGTVSKITVVPYNPKEDPTNNPSNTFSPYYYPSILEMLAEIKETLILEIQPDDGGIAGVERALDLGITQSWFCAMNCFTVGLHDPCVLFSSISVENILNHDLRLEDDRTKARYQWLDLDVKNLRLAQEKGLPTDLLLNKDENFMMQIIEFVYRRNKVAHGDIRGYQERYSGVYSSDAFADDAYVVDYKRPSKEHAIDQLNKAKKFIVEWAKQNPKILLH